MGLFINQNNSKTMAYASYVNGNNYNQYGGSYNFGEMLLQNLPSLFMMGLNQFAEDDSVDDGKGGEEKTEKLSRAQRKEKEALEQKLQQVFEKYSEYNVTDIAGLKQKSTETDTQITNKNNEIEKNKSNASTLQLNIQDLKDQITAAEASPTVSNQDEQKALATLRNELSNKEQALQDLENKIKQDETEVTKLQALKVYFETGIGEAENIQLQIDRINNSNASPEVKYNVQQETTDIANFSQALKAFKDNPNPSTALVLKNAYEGKNGFNEDVNNATIQNAWKTFGPKVEQILNSIPKV